jgi:hypothetical protein
VADWRWKLRLFVSADLVGSTAYKSNTTADKPEWAATFKEFFRDFPVAVERAYSKEPQSSWNCLEHLAPWKFSGDEILFWVELHDYRESISHLLAFKHAVLSFPELWAEKKVPLRLKATAWLAGFPVTNTEIEISTDADRRTALDFIGPSIDMGFRIAKYADARRMVVSADLALMILDAVETLEVERGHFHIHLQSKEVLKGVIGNMPYPILWIDMFNGRPDLEERLLGIQRAFRSDDMKDFLRQFIDETPRLRRPFIAEDKDPRYNTVDADLVKLRDAMQNEDGKLTLTNEGEVPVAGEPRMPKDPEPPENGLTLGMF